jgi:hypothetical protein
MSLELAAQHLASRGRKGDTMLVHMAPQEVSGLQALAKAHGGTLTVNPDTGLPEANFLKRMLPMLIGAALTPLTGGLINPMTAGLLVGGVETARTGNLGKGLMAGLGAYGGAGLGAGLMGAGAGTAGATASALGVPGAATGAGSQAAMLAAQNQGFGQAGLEALGSSAGYASGAAPVVQSGMQSLGAGVQGLGTEAGRNAALSSMGGGMGAAKYGLAALSPMLMQGDSQTPFAGSGPNPYEYDYDPNTQRYTRVPPGSRQRDILAPTTQMAAAGGTVEEMSNQNRMDTMMANGGQMFATGGQINLQGTFDVGGGGGGQSGQANTNGYQAAGSGGGGGGLLAGMNGGGGGGGGGGMLVGMGGTAENGFMSPGGTGSSNIGNLMQQLQRVQQQQMGGIDQRAVQANPQGFQQWLNGAQQQEKQMPGSTMLAGLYGGAARPSYDEYVASNNQRLAEKNQAGSVASMTHDYVGPTASRSAWEASQNNPMNPAGRFAAGGVSNLGDYSDGGRLLKGPGDGVSDSIPATIADKRPARLADGEFVVPARIVSELGNGSTEAGARKLYAMMDRIQKARGKTTGKNRVAVNSRSEKLLPA